MGKYTKEDDDFIGNSKNFDAFFRTVWIFESDVFSLKSIHNFIVQNLYDSWPDSHS